MFMCDEITFLSLLRGDAQEGEGHKVESSQRKNEK
jgi:hypothetical protein